MPDNNADELKKHPSIIHLYTSRVRLKRNGKELEGLCPLHADKDTPSFKVRQTPDGIYLWNCFGCNVKGGNIFQLLQKLDSISFNQAVENVRQYVGESWTEQKTVVEQTFRPIAPQPETVKKFTMEAYATLEKALANNQEAQEWLKNKRGIGMETAKRLRLGYRHDLGRIAGENSVVADKGWISHPIIEGDEVVGLEYRSIVEKQFRKQPGMRQGLFNANTIDFLDPVFLTEGAYDVASLEQAGFRAVSLPNAQHTLTPAERDLLLSAEYVILAGDNDEAGKKAMEKLWREMNISGRVFYLKWPGMTKDANEFYLKDCKGSTSVFRAKVQELVTDARSRPLPNVVSLPESMQQSTWSGLESHPDRLTFPWKQIDSMVNLLPGSVLNVTATQTGMGKTAWLMNLLIHACKQGKTVLNYSAELSAEEYGNIVTAHILRKDRSDVSPEDLKAAARMIAGYKFYIGRDPDAHNSDQVLDLLDKAIPILGIDIFAVDHIHHICQGKTNDVKDQNEAIVKIKNIATKHGVCAIVVSQPRKADANSKGKEIHITDIKGGGGIADASDAVISLHRDFIKTVDPENPPAEPYEALTKVRLLKGRSQGRGKAYCELAFLGALATFSEVVHTSEPDTLFS